MLERKQTDTQNSIRSLGEQILENPSGLKLDGNPSGRECDDIFEYLREKGIKSGEEKIAYLKEMALLSGDEYLKNLGVTNDTLNKVLECIRPRQERWDSAKRQNESLEETVNYLFERDINRDIVQEKNLKVQKISLYIAVVALAIAVLSFLRPLFF